jgi:hypothetical protein
MPERTPVSAWKFNPIERTHMCDNGTKVTELVPIQHTKQAQRSGKFTVLGHDSAVSEGTDLGPQPGPVHCAASACVVEMPRTFGGRRPLLLAVDDACPC